MTNKYVDKAKSLEKIGNSQNNKKIIIDFLNGNIKLNES